MKPLKSARKTSTHKKAFLNTCCAKNVHTRPLRTSRLSIVFLCLQQRMYMIVSWNLFVQPTKIHFCNIYKRHYYVVLPTKDMYMYTSNQWVWMVNKKTSVAAVIYHWSTMFVNTHFREWFCQFQIKSVTESTSNKCSLKFNKKVFLRKICLAGKKVSFPENPCD